MDVIIPALGESVTEATIGQWLKKVGDTVAADEPIVSLETDKVAVEVNAPAAGTISELLYKEGDTVTVGQIIAYLGEGGAAAPAGGATKPVEKTATKLPDPLPAAGPSPVIEKVSAEQSASPAPAPKAEAASAESATYEALAPAVRVLVETYNLDPASITGTGKDSRLTKGDVLAAIEAGTAKVKGGAAAAPAAAAGPARREERVRMTRLRQTIARRLKEAQNTAAILTTFNDVDMTAVMEARNRYKDLFEKKHGVRLGFMSFFTKAVVLALKDVPSVNGAIEGDEIVFRDYADIGVAVSGPAGLVVPILRDADQKSFADIELEIAAFGKRARDNALTMADMKGGTFTISNGGVFGSLMSTPIINPPQSAVLGMHRIEDRPVVRNGQVVVRPMMYLALSYDHRLIDGREAVTFLVRIKEALEDPTRLVIDL